MSPGAERTDPPGPAATGASGEAEWLAAIEERHRRGDYAGAAAWADALPPAARARPRVALARARARMRQGRMKDASAALAESDRAAATPGERLLVAVEEAWLGILRDMAVRAALEQADAALAAADAAAGEVDPADRAEAEIVRVRIRLTARNYYELGAEEARQAWQRLPDLADVLDRAGRTDRALAARFTHAEQVEDPVDRLAALAIVAGLARDAGRAGLAGEAQVARAEQMLAGGAAGDAIRAALAEAEALFAAAGHAHGLIDARRVRAELAVAREQAPLDKLAACAEEYRRIDYPRGVFSLVLDLSQRAHERGDTRAAAAYRQQLLKLAEEAGLGLARDSVWMSLADLLMRAADYGGAVELCQAALAANPPAFSAASYEQLLATAYTFVNDQAAAQAHMRRALAGYESLGAVDSASNAVLKFASDLDGTRREESWDEAERLLRQWREADEHRGAFAAAVAKREMLAQIAINRYVYSPARRGDVRLLAAAEQELAAGEAVAGRLHGVEAARRLGALQQMRGQLAQLRGDEAGVEQAWRQALAVYEQGGLAMEAANCRHILGVLALNRAYHQLMPHFVEAERNLREALEYYDPAGMRERAADTRFMLARLYTNAAPHVREDLGEQMLDAALGHLAEGEAAYDALRREFAAGSVLAAQRAKQTFAERSQRIYEQALEVLVGRNDAAGAWGWCQRAKARALGDALGTSETPPARILVELEAHPEAAALAARERDLAARLEAARAVERTALRAELAALRERMAGEPSLAEYLALRAGAAVEPADLQRFPGRLLCIDWVQVGDRLLMLALRPGEAPRLVPLEASAGRVRALALTDLAADKFRLTLRDAPELLDEFAPLVAPLAELSQPGERLVLAPTGPLYALPLHALTVDGQPLLQRNPVVYSPSLSILRHCLARRTPRTPGAGRRTVALFGDPGGDRGEAAELVAYLGQRFGARPRLRDEVTRAAFAEGVAGCDLVHFQGHARHDPDDPLDSRLLLAGGERFTARDVFGLRRLRAELVALGACESAASVIRTGDEPLGLIPAFLVAGAGAVLAALWPVHRASAAHVMRRFYDALADGQVDKAEALRGALLAVREEPGFEAPYHWAPFALYGDWR